MPISGDSADRPAGAAPPGPAAYDRLWEFERTIADRRHGYWQARLVGRYHAAGHNPVARHRIEQFALRNGFVDVANVWLGVCLLSVMLFGIMFALLVAVSRPVFLVPFVASCLLMLGLGLMGVTRAVQGYRIFPHWSLGHLLVQGDPSTWSVPERERLRPRTVDGAMQLPASWRAGVLVQRWMLLPLAGFLALLAALNLTSGQESMTDKVGNALLLVPLAVVLAWIGWTSGRSRTMVTPTTVEVTSTWGVRRVVHRSDLVDVVRGRRRVGGSGLDLVRGDGTRVAVDSIGRWEPDELDRLLPIARASVGLRGAAAPSADLPPARGAPDGGANR